MSELEKCKNCKMDAHCPEPLYDKTGEKICKKCDCSACERLSKIKYEEPIQ